MSSTCDMHGTSAVMVKGDMPDAPSGIDTYPHGPLHVGTMRNVMSITRK